MTPDYIALLQALAIFGGIKRDIVELILENSPIVTREQNQYFFHEGDTADAMYVLEMGRVAVLKGWGDKQYLMRRLRSGDSIGEMALVDMQPRSASVLAESECLAIRINTETFRKIFQRDTEQFMLIQMNMAREISRRLRQTDQELFRLCVEGEAPAELAVYSGPEQVPPKPGAGIRHL